MVGLVLRAEHTAFTSRPVSIYLILARPPSPHLQPSLSGLSYGSCPTLFAEVPFLGPCHHGWWQQASFHRTFSVGAVAPSVRMLILSFLTWQSGQDQERFPPPLLWQAFCMRYKSPHILYVTHASSCLLPMRTTRPVLGFEL